MELFVRKTNASLYERHWRPLESNAPPGLRAHINQTAFALVRSTRRKHAVLDHLFSALRDDDEIRAAEELVAGTSILDSQGRFEASDLAYRIACHLFRTLGEPVSLDPTFPGCGILNTCAGDAITPSGRIIELKDGDRPFRNYEFRQLTCYAALHLNATGNIPRSLAVVNSRRGVSVEVELGLFANEVAGQSALTFLRETIRVISDTTISG